MEEQNAHPAVATVAGTNVDIHANGVNATLTACGQIPMGLLDPLLIR